ncbi:VOC family protein [Streptomyces sp. NPDC004838]
MANPNLFLVYVTDIERSTRFYSDLFDIKPTVTVPDYVAFEVAPGVLFALWSGHGDNVTPATQRTSEIGLMLPGDAAAIDAVYEQWRAKEVTVLEEPNDSGYGRTFAVTDPDGNLIRVCPAG